METIITNNDRAYQLEVEINYKNTHIEWLQEKIQQINSIDMMGAYDICENISRLTKKIVKLRNEMRILQKTQADVMGWFIEQEEVLIIN